MVDRFFTKRQMSNQQPKETKEKEKEQKENLPLSLSPLGSFMPSEYLRSPPPRRTSVQDLTFFNIRDLDALEPHSQPSQSQTPAESVDPPGFVEYEQENDSRFCSNVDYDENTPPQTQREEMQENEDNNFSVHSFKSETISEADSICPVPAHATLFKDASKTPGSFLVKRKKGKSITSLKTFLYASVERISNQSRFLIRKIRGQHVPKFIPQKEFSCTPASEKLASRLRILYNNFENEKSKYNFIYLGLSFSDLYPMFAAMMTFKYFGTMPEPPEYFNDDYQAKMKENFQEPWKYIKSDSPNFAEMFLTLFKLHNPFKWSFTDIGVTFDYETEYASIWFRHEKEWNLTKTRNKIAKLQEITDNYKAVEGLFKPSNPKPTGIATISYQILTPMSFAQKVIDAPNSDFYTKNGFRGYMAGGSCLLPLSLLSKNALLMAYVICCPVSAFQIARLFKVNLPKEPKINYSALIESRFYNIDNFTLEETMSKDFKIWLDNYTSTLKSKKRRAQIVQHCQTFENTYERIWSKVLKSLPMKIQIFKVFVEMFLAFLYNVIKINVEKETEIFLTWENNQAIKKSLDKHLTDLEKFTESWNFTSQWREQILPCQTQSQIQTQIDLFTVEFAQFCDEDSNEISKRISQFIEEYYMDEDGEWKKIINGEGVRFYREANFLLQIHDYNQAPNPEKVVINFIDKVHVEKNRAAFMNYLILWNKVQIEKELDAFWVKHLFEERMGTGEFDKTERGLVAFSDALARLLDVSYEKSTGLIITGASNLGKTYFCSKLQKFLQPLWPVQSAFLGSDLNRYSCPALRGMIIYEEFKCNKTNLFENFQYTETNVSEMYTKTSRERVKFTFDVYIMDLWNSSWNNIVNCSYSKKKGDPTQIPGIKLKVEQVQNRLTVLEASHEEFGELMSITKKLSVSRRKTIDRFLDESYKTVSHWEMIYSQIVDNLQIFTEGEIFNWSSIFEVNVVTGKPDSWSIVSELIDYYPWFYFFRKTFQASERWSYERMQDIDFADLESYLNKIL